MVLEIIIIWKGLMFFFYFEYNLHINYVARYILSSGEKSERNHWVFCQCPGKDLESKSWVSGYCPEKPLGFWLLPGETTLTFWLLLGERETIGFLMTFLPRVLYDRNWSVCSLALQRIICLKKWLVIIWFTP